MKARLTCIPLLAIGDVIHRESWKVLHRASWGLGFETERGFSLDKYGNQCGKISNNISIELNERKHMILWVLRYCNDLYADGTRR